MFSKYVGISVSRPRATRSEKERAVKQNEYQPITVRHWITCKNRRKPCEVPVEYARSLHGLKVTTISSKYFPTGNGLDVMSSIKYHSSVATALNDAW